MTLHVTGLDTATLVGRPGAVIIFICCLSALIGLVRIIRAEPAVVFKWRTIEPTSDTSGLAIRARAVVKTFGAGDSKVQALKGVNLDVNFGEMMIIVGPSGCGKTTFLSIVCGTLGFDSGEVHVFDRETQGAELARSSAAHSGSEIV